MGKRKSNVNFKEQWMSCELESESVFDQSFLFTVSVFRHWNGEWWIWDTLMYDRRSLIRPLVTTQLPLQLTEMEECNWDSGRISCNSFHWRASTLKTGLIYSLLLLFWISFKCESASSAISENCQTCFKMGPDRHQFYSFDVVCHFPTLDASIKRKSFLELRKMGAKKTKWQQWAVMECFVSVTRLDGRV